MKRLRFSTSVILLGLAFLGFSRLALADGILLNGVSARTIGRGGTNLAHNDNGGLIFDNPAGLVRVNGDGLLEVSVVGLFTDFEYSDPSNPLAKDNTFTPLPQVSITQKSADGQWAWGLGVFTPAGFMQSYELQGPFPYTGQRRYESFGSLTKILPAASWQATDRLSVGGTFGLAISHVELEGPYFLQSPGILQGVPTSIDMQGTGTSLAWSLGMQYELTPDTTIGASYQSNSWFKLDGSASVSVPILGQSRYDADINITWPQTAGVGVRHRLVDRHVISADLYWTDWSGALDDIGVTLSDPHNPLFFPVSEQIPLRWRDSIAVRLGHEWDLEEYGVLRLGYVYHRNPIPTNTLTPFIQATMEHALSWGYGFEVQGYEIDLSYMFVFGGRDTVGTSGLIGGDFSNSRQDAQTHAICLGVVRRF